VLADITPVILTYNESANIGRSLERLTWAREVVVVDSGSTDDTLAIVARFPNARVFKRPFDTHAEQWRFATAETGVTSIWILRLDADYIMEPALRDEVAALNPDAGTAAYQIAFTYSWTESHSGLPSIPRCRFCSAAAASPSSRTAIPRSCVSTGR
jgi:glycosyltransferase involved in cell wall biosynthesis